MKFTRRAIGSAAVAALATALSVGVVPGTADAAPRTFQFKGFGTGQCMVANMSTRTVQANKCAAFTSQGWQLLPTNTVSPDGFQEFEIRNVPFAVCARAGDTAPHGALLLGTCDPSDRMTVFDQLVPNFMEPQQFRLKGFNVCIDRPSEFPNDGSNLQVYTCNHQHTEQLISLH